MALGDGIRRNVATITQEERNRLRNAFVELNRQFYPGSREDQPLAGGVSFWFKQDEIHQATHIHGGPAFLPWHRELCNRLEALLRRVDPMLSLHYWDWRTDPRGLFTPDFMGSPTGAAGEPWLSAGYYNPNAAQNRVRDLTGNPADPPRMLTRDLQTGSPQLPFSEEEILAATTFQLMRNRLESSHGASHGYIGGTIGLRHSSFEDPFVFLLHSNVDRLFARWQTDPQHPWRLDPNQVYGIESNTGGRDGILAPLDPWAGNPLNDPGIARVRPWAPPENQQVLKNSRHMSVVTPPPYDTNHQPRSAFIVTPHELRTAIPGGRHLWVGSGIAVLDPPFVGGPGADASPGAWRRDILEFTIGPTWESIDRVVPAVSLASIENQGQSINAGWAVDEVRWVRVGPPRNSRIRLSVRIAVRDTDGVINRVTYQATALGQPR
jgi:hypothetical protein